LLRESWRSERGRKRAEDIAFRKMTFADFTTAQIVRWLAAGMRLRVQGWENRERPLTPAEDRLIEWLADDLRGAFVRGEQKPWLLLRLLEPGTVGYKDWKGTFTQMPLQRRGALAYVLGCYYLRTLKQPEKAREFFSEAAPVLLGIPRSMASDPLFLLDHLRHRLPAFEEATRGWVSSSPGDMRQLSLYKVP
jgi:hypothetical protein